MVQKFFRKAAARELSGFGYTEFHEAVRDGRFPKPDAYLGPRTPIWTEGTLAKWQLTALSREPEGAEHFREHCRTAGKRSALLRAADRVGGKAAYLMEPTKAAGAITARSSDNPRKLSAGELTANNTFDRLSFQVGRLVLRFGLTESHAVVVASLAFSEASR
jgi:hypothetical protein